ncbi:MAG: DUF1549 domain-containing protein [Verrucomicrobia bacterium]|nr:DUF1549 domain-containing protein [Verrucomicrobiota bacterium]
MSHRPDLRVRSRIPSHSTMPAWALRLFLGAALLPLLATAKLKPEQAASLPPPAAKTVRFQEDIRPILESACVKCHGRGKAKGGFSIETRELLLKGGDSGAAVTTGQSVDSLLIELVSGIDPANAMPRKGSKLTPAQVGLLRAWIDQGLPWDDGISFAKQPARNLSPRAAELPPIRTSEHPVDRFIDAYDAAHSIARVEGAGDRVFARRVSFDLLGVPMPRARMDEFLKDAAPDKRTRLVDQLLKDQQGYAAHWFSFWNDLLRNDYKGTGYIDSGRKQISTWLHSALVTNMPYDQFVRELIHPSPATEGYTKGIVWRGVVNASVTPPMQAAQNISQVFMGVNLKCASCHDSFINDWSLADSYGLASVYADEPLELVECDKPTGKKAVARFLYPQLGVLPSDAPRTNRTERLAEILTSRGNGRLTRTVVNRLWGRLMGRALVEPVDDMDQDAWYPELLDWLAEDLASHGYDLKRTLRWIVTSRAYQRPAVDLGERRAADFVFRGPGIRSLSAEQFRDALGALTGVWHSDAAADFDLATGGDPVVEKYASIPSGARWIWSTPGAQESAPPGEAFFRKTFTLESIPDRATVVALADDAYTLFINGAQLITGKDLERASFGDLRPHLKKGQNLFAVQASNAAPKEKDKSKDKESAKAADAPKNRAGLFVFARLESGEGSMEIFTDASWQCVTNNPADWKQPDFGASRWVPAAEVAPWNESPWPGKVLATRALSLAAMHGQIRESLVASDTLTSALGRPPREQVVTVRASTITTLQALELANGETLARLLKEGAQKWIASKPANPEALARDLYVKAFSRTPNDAELGVAKEMLGTVMDEPRVEDFLWAIAMQPEFQLIY